MCCACSKTLRRRRRHRFWRWHSNRRCIPVSYTHLDVYKRQLYPDLDLEIAKADERFLVTVRFPVQIPILDYAMNGEVTSYTMLVD